MNSILNQLDSFFRSQKESEQKLFFLLPILLFGFLSYYFFYPVTDHDLNKAMKKNKSLHSKISKIKSKNLRLKNENIRLERSIVKINKEIKILQNNKKEIDSLLSKLLFLRFDLNKWANFYNEIPMMAKKSNLVIVSLENDMILDFNPSKLVEKKMEVKINLIGNFVDFIRFINKFETKKELVKVKSINTNGSKMSIVIDIYGAKL